ncbi:unnamed protein product [Alopecurus aequalis]
MEQRDADKMQQAGNTGDAPERRNEQHEPSSLNPTAARLVRESIVSKPAEGEKQGGADGSSDILAVARSVGRVDSSLE